jgi:hypothetical protein
MLGGLFGNIGALLLLGIITGWWSLKMGLILGIAITILPALNHARTISGGTGGGTGSMVGTWVQNLFLFVLSLVVLPVVGYVTYLIGKYAFPGAPGLQFYQLPAMAFVLAYVARLVMGQGDPRGVVYAVSTVAGVVLVGSVVFDIITDTTHTTMTTVSSGGSVKDVFSPPDWQQQVQEGDFFEIEVVFGEGNFRDVSGNTLFYPAGGDKNRQWIDVDGTGPETLLLPEGAVIPAISSGGTSVLAEEIEFRGEPGSTRAIVGGIVPDGVSGITTLDFNSSVIGHPLVGSKYELKVRVNPPRKNTTGRLKRKLKSMWGKGQREIPLRGPGKKTQVLDLGEAFVSLDSSLQTILRYKGLGTVEILGVGTTPVTLPLDEPFSLGTLKFFHSRIRFRGGLQGEFVEVKFEKNLSLPHHPGARTVLVNLTPGAWSDWVKVPSGSEFKINPSNEIKIHFIEGDTKILDPIKPYKDFGPRKGKFKFLGTGTVTVSWWKR